MIEIISLLDELDIETDKSEGVIFSKELYEIAQRFSLTAYDAAYLELAIRNDASFASLDSQLLKAAKNTGLNIL